MGTPNFFLWKMDELDCALDLMRRLPPKDVGENLAGVIDLVPDLMDSLLSAVDQPLRVEKDEASGKDFLLCDYNRDGDSYRSPWSNEYNPPLDYEGTFPSDRLRAFEEKANGVFDTYRSLYYEGGVSSVYAWDLDTGFACVVLIKKTEDGSGKKAAKGTWDSIHVVEVQENGAEATYKITSTIMLSLITNMPGCDDVDLSGSLTRQSTSASSWRKWTPRCVPPSSSSTLARPTTSSVTSAPTPLSTRLTLAKSSPKKPWPKWATALDSLPHLISHLSHHPHL